MWIATQKIYFRTDRFFDKVSFSKNKLNKIKFHCVLNILLQRVPSSTEFQIVWRKRTNFPAMGPRSSCSERCSTLWAAPTTTTSRSSLETISRTSTSRCWTTSTAATWERPTSKMPSYFSPTAKPSAPAWLRRRQKQKSFGPCWTTWKPSSPKTWLRTTKSILSWTGSVGWSETSWSGRSWNRLKPSSSRSRISSSTSSSGTNTCQGIRSFLTENWPGKYNHQKREMVET